MATQHPLEFAKEKARKRPSSRAAMRRRVARAEREEERRHDASRSSSPRQSSSRRPMESRTKNVKDRHNTETATMAEIQREMRRAVTAN